MKNNCWLCGGTRKGRLRVIYFFKDSEFGKLRERSEFFHETCMEEILTQHVLEYEAKDKAMSERMNRHEAEKEL